MPLLIDGHNLIGSGQLPGIALSDEDDELQLVRLLRRYRSRVRGKLTVVFDSGIPGGFSKELSGGGVEVVFAASQRHRADDVIAARLRHARNPAGLTLVSADHVLVQLARSRGAKVLSPPDFAARLLSPLPDSRRVREEPPLSPSEVEEWLSFFDGE